MGLLPLVVGTFVDTVKFGVTTAVIFGTLVAGAELVLYADRKIESVKNPGNICSMCGRRVRGRRVRGRK